eukprot:gene21051-27278_t
MSHFNTAEVFDSKSIDSVRDEIFKNSLQSDKIETNIDTWRRSRNKKLSDSNDSEGIQLRRLENLSWRMMSMGLPNQSATPLSNQRKRFQCSISQDDFHSDMESQDNFSIPKYTEDSIRKINKSSPQSLSIGSDMNYLNIEDNTNVNAEKNETKLSTLDWLEVEVPKSSLEKPPLFKLLSNSPRNRSHSFVESEPSPKYGTSNVFSVNAESPKSPQARNRTDSRASSYYNGNRAFERRGGHLGKGVLNVEFADHGTGDFRSPSFVVIDTYDGSSISPLRYRRYTIYKGKLPLPDNLPGLRFLNDNQATTLVVTMADVGSGLEVDLVYVVLHDFDAITRRTVFRNIDTRVRYTCDGSIKYTSKIIQIASSCTLDYESTSTPFYLVQLSGSWGRERYVVETKLTHGTQSFGSTKGVSGHQHNPFAALSIGPPSETTGEVKGFSLIYSGNFQFEAQLSEMGRLRINMGIHSMGFQWNLKQGENFNTPEVVLVRSNEGIGGMSRVFHRLFLDHLIAPLPDWARVNPPVLLNSWEAKYFDVNHGNIVDMAKQASRIGVDLIVIDDGWFGARNDDTTSLGDWKENFSKFPQGLNAVAKEVNSYGCRLGLWFEPEMVSEQSVLHSLHPDWYLRVPGRPRQIGRNQMVLDFSRVEVRNYLFDEISSVLRSANIHYIKWDMNRPLTEVYSQRDDCDQDHNKVWQSESSHRYVLGVYDLQDRITREFPHVLLENCASGGGRFDPGMLFYSPQIWCSDNTDAIVRMKIQFGTSYAYPASCIGSHVSTIPNHITGNSTRARTRSFVAMCGTYGFELDINEVTSKDKSLYRHHIAIYKAIAPLIRKGDLYRLWDPFKINFAAWMYVSRNKNYSVVFAFSLNSDHWSNLVPRLLLQGLKKDVEYEVIEPAPNNIIQSSGNLKIMEVEVPIYQLGYPSVILTGEILMSAGLPVRFYTLDDSAMFFLTIACQDGTIRLYDHRQNGKAFSIHDAKSDTARDVHYSPLEEHLLAAVFDNGSWSAWDSRISGRPLVKVSGHTSNGYSISWHHSKEGYLATGSRDKTVKIWNMNTIIPQANQIEIGGQLKPEVTINTPNSVGRVNWRPDQINTISNQIATTSCLERGDIDIWETSSSNVPAIVIQDRKDACSDFKWFYNESNNYMVSVGRDGWLLLHDITGGHQPRSRVSPCVSTISSRGNVVYYRGQRNSNQGDIFTGLAGITNLSEAHTIRSLSKQQRAEGSVFDPAMIGLLAKSYQTGWENVCSDYHSQALSACIHNKSIALAAGLNCRAAVWSIAITLLSDCESTFIFSIDILGDLLRELLEGGDCIHFVVLSE